MPALAAAPHAAPNHHPGTLALANLQKGDCTPGSAVVLSAHVSACPQCAWRVEAMGSPVNAVAEPMHSDWTPYAAGIEVAFMPEASGLGEAVFHLRAEPSRLLPLRIPLELAEVLVLQGGLEIDGETYLAGDFRSLEEHPAARISAGGETGCICLVTAFDRSAV
jgi:anti-sigma factor ChrR (cupin superfamily)